MLTQLNRQKTCCSILKKSSTSRSDHELTLLSAVMREVPQFQQLDAPSLKALGQQMQIRRFAKGEVIVQEGDYGNEFYVLLTGAVNIYATVAEMDPKTKVAPRLVDYTVVAQAEAPEKSPSAPKAKSRTLRALNRRISYTVDWDAMEKKAKPGGGEELEGTSSSTLGRRGSMQGQGKRRGSTFSDSESEEEDMEDLRPRGGLGHSSSSLARAMMRRDSCEEKSPRKQQGPQLRTALLFPGSSFGELGLNPTPIARQSTAKCEEKCAVAILRREDYDEILTKTQSSRRAEWLAFACQAPILRNFDLLKHLHLEAHMKIQQVSKGEKVMKIGDPLQVLFLAEGVFAVSMPAQGAEASKPEVTTALMAPPGCFGLSAHFRNDTQFQESLTSCSAGKLYVLQTKHLLMMLTSHQQEALTRAAYHEQGFHLARLSVMQSMTGPLTRRLYSASPRLELLRKKLHSAYEAQEGDAKVPPQASRKWLEKCWSTESIFSPAKPIPTLKEKVPPLAPDRAVAGEDVPRTRLHRSLLPQWSPAMLEDRQRLHVGQEQGVFHGYGPPVEVNGFITQFYKVHRGPWSHAFQSASAPSLKAAAKAPPTAAGEEEEFFDSFEDDSMSPILDAKIKETVRRQRIETEWLNKAEKAAMTVQGIVRAFLRRRKKQNHAAACIQRIFRSRRRENTPEDFPSAPSGTPEAELCLTDMLEVEDVPKDPVTPPTTRHGSIVQLDLDAAPKLQDLKKALGLGRSSTRSARLSTRAIPFIRADGEEAPKMQLELPKAKDVQQLFVPVDLIEKHKLLMQNEVLDEWPQSERLPTLTRLRRKWEKVDRGSVSSEVVALAPAEPMEDLARFKLPMLPSPRGSLVFSARLSASHEHGEHLDYWSSRSKEAEKDEIDLWEIYRPRPSQQRFRSTLRRYG